MKPGKIIIYNIMCFSALSEMFASAGKISTKSSREIRNSTRSVNFLPGIKLVLSQDGVFVNVNFGDLFAVNEATGREGGGDTQEGSKKKRTGIVKKIGRLMMMMPLLMQIMRLPNEIAEIKVSLIRSILIAKMALIMIIFNAIRNSRKSGTVVVHQPQQQVHEHYYHEHDYHEPEDNDQGWLG